MCATNTFSSNIEDEIANYFLNKNISQNFTEKTTDQAETGNLESNKY